MEASAILRLLERWQREGFEFFACDCGGYWGGFFVPI
jgi:hypothetical protein